MLFLIHQIYYTVSKEFIYPGNYSAFIFHNYRFVQPQEVSIHPSTVFCFSYPLYHTIASCAWF